MEIAAVVVYRVVDGFKAAFAVDDYEESVRTRSETAVRQVLCGDRAAQPVVNTGILYS